MYRVPYPSHPSCSILFLRFVHISSFYKGYCFRPSIRNRKPIHTRVAHKTEKSTKEKRKYMSGSSTRDFHSQSSNNQSPKSQSSKKTKIIQQMKPLSINDSKDTDDTSHHWDTNHHSHSPHSPHSHHSHHSHHSISILSFLQPQH